MDNKVSKSTIFKTFPRREKIVENALEFNPPPMSKPVKFRKNFLMVAQQLLKWFFAIFYFLFTTIREKHFKVSSTKRNGAHLRMTLEWMGGTMVKIGQQLSMRIDLLPYEYCEELGKLLDQHVPFHYQKAIERIEAISGKKLDEIFLAFDPDPIGSASIACVYRAQLKCGTHVAVKVRRPGIGELFMADLTALDIVCFVLEFFTILRPGYTKPFRKGLKDTLMEEMDFRKEARYQELFRTSQEKNKKNSIGSPKVFLKYSGEDVLTMEYVDGILLSDILTVLERGDESGKRALQEMEIDPKTIARRLLRISHMSMISELFFHADPHPANIIVQKNSKLMFIDFGSCGSFSHSQKQFLRQINYYQCEGDPEGMASATLGLLQPLPPIDLDEFSRELEKIYRESIYAMVDENAEWWERTTGVYWIAFMKIAIKYKVPLPVGLVHMVRATMLYDTISVRLDSEINFYEEFRRFEKLAGNIARKRIHGQIKQTLTDGIDPRYYLRFEQLKNMGNRLLFYLQNSLYSNPLKFVSSVSKGYYFIVLIIRSLMLIFTLIGLLFIGNILYNRMEGQSVDFWGIVNSIISSSWNKFALLLALCILVRRVLFRFDDKDI